MSTIHSGTADPDLLKAGPFLANFTKPPEVKALSWKQPFGSLMLHGKEETRCWLALYRGWVLIGCSAKRYSSADHLAIAGETQYKRGVALLENEPTAPLRGVAIGIGKLSQVQPMQPMDEDQCFVQHDPDLLRDLYTMVYRIEPFPVKGGQRWRNITQAQLNEITILAQPGRS